MTYAEKLQSPNWQKKRLETFDRDNWMCQDCGSDKVNLQVHHKYYEYGRDPWDYPENCFITLCKNCHKKEHELIPESEPERKYAHLLVMQQVESMATAIKTHVEMLKASLKKVHTPEIETEILKNILFLQQKEKEYRNG